MAGALGCQGMSGLLQAHADGALSASERGPVEEHLASCPACAKEGERLKDNGAFLREVFEDFRMPADFSTDFLFQLPRKDGKRKAAAPAAAAPRSEVMGDTRPRRANPLLWIAGLGFLAAAGVLGWLFLSPDPEPVKRFRNRPEPRPEPPPAVVKRAGGKEGPAGPTVPPKPVPLPSTVPSGIRTTAELVIAARGFYGENYGPIVQRGWELLAGAPDEAKSLRTEAAREQNPKTRAALVLCLGASADEESRAALRAFLADEDPGVRAAAILGLAKSLTGHEPARRAVHTGPPLNMAVQIGALPEGLARAEILGRLSVESNPEAVRVLVFSLAPTAPEDAAIRARILEGVKGVYGDELRQTCLLALQGIRDAALVPGLAETLTQPGLPGTLHAMVIDAMVQADQGSAAEALSGILLSSSVQSAELRRAIALGCGRAGAGSERGLIQVLSGDADTAVRQAAVLSLARIPSREVLDALQHAAERDPDANVKQEAERVAKEVRRVVEKPEGTQGGDNPPPAEVPPAEGK